MTELSQLPKEAYSQNKMQCGALHHNWIADLGKIQFTELYCLLIYCLLQDCNSLQEWRGPSVLEVSSWL